MNCREALEQFHDHVDGEMTPHGRWRLRLHLWICGHCRKYLRSYKTTVQAERAAFAEPDGTATTIPSEMVSSILAAAKISAVKDDGDIPNGEPEGSNEAGPGASST